MKCNIATLGLYILMDFFHFTVYCLDDFHLIAHELLVVFLCLFFKYFFFFRTPAPQMLLCRHIMCPDPREVKFWVNVEGSEGAQSGSQVSSHSTCTLENIGWDGKLYPKILLK